MSMGNPLLLAWSNSGISALAKAEQESSNEERDNEPRLGPRRWGAHRSVLQRLIIRPVNLGTDESMST